MRDTMVADGQIKGIPLPVPRCKFPWKEMQVGDSFLLPKGRNGNGIHTAGEAQGFKVSVRKEKDRYRVFRIA